MNTRSLILRAASFAADRHRDQRRKGVDESPYINRPFAVASARCDEGGVTDRERLIERDVENAWLAAGAEPGPLDDLMHSITYRIAVGPRAGQKLFTLQLLPARPPEEAGDPSGPLRAGGLDGPRDPAQLIPRRDFPALLRKPVATDWKAFPPPLTDFYRGMAFTAPFSFPYDRQIASVR